MYDSENRIKELEALLSKALARIAELERRLDLNSKTSSKPPSSDGLRKKPSPRSLRSKGKNPSGGQSGHKGTTLKQVSAPDHAIVHAVTSCSACQASLKNVMPIAIVERQVFDIPPQTWEVTAHLAEVKLCSCGQKTRSCFPSEVTAPVQYGPRVKALSVYLSHQQLIPEDRIKQIFGDFFSLSIATSSIAKFSADFANFVGPLQESVLTKLKVAPVKHLDETSLRIGGKTQWLHVISTDQATHYRVSPKRGDLLFGVQGVVVHDHWKPYFTMDGVTHALCNAHHLRELQSLIEIEKESWAKKMSQLLRLLSRMKEPPLARVIALYDRIVEDGLSFHETQPAVGGRKRRVGHNLLRRLRDFKDAVLRFVTTRDVAFTNNQAEQDIRMMKVKQKISGGFRASSGAQIFATIRGFISTKRKQKQNVFEAITAQFA